MTVRRAKAGRSDEDAVALQRRVAELERENRRLRETAALCADRREKELAESRQRYQDLVENMNDVIYSTDPDGKVTSVSRAIKAWINREPREIIGTNIREWAAPAEAEKVEAARRCALAGERVTTEVTFHNEKGDERFAEISVAPALVGGRIVGTQGIVRDITARRRAERDVREREEKLRALLNATTESVLLLDREGTVLTLNETAAQRFGKSVGELIGTKIADVGEHRFPAETVAYRTKRISEILRTRQAVRFEDERLGRRFDTSVYPVLDEKGEVRQLAIFGKDITEHKRAGEEVRSLQRQIEFILGATRTGLDIIDAQFNLRYVDPAWQQAYGPYQGRKCYEYFMGRSEVCPGCGISRTLARKQTTITDAVLIREGDRPVQVTTIPFQAEDGEWLVAEVNADITERKRLEEKLRMSEERYRTVVEGAGETIAVVNQQGVFEFINGTAARRFGGQPSDFVGKTMWDLFPPEIADRQMAIVRKVMDTLQGVNVEVPTCIQGQRRWYNTTIEPLKDSNGRATAGLVIGRDIHELKQAQDELEAYRERMTRAEHLASLGTLSATLAHELTQPLTVVRLSMQNALETLAGTPGVATAATDLQDGLAEVSHAAAIVGRFRDFARRSTEKATQKVVLAEVARRTMRLLRDGAVRARVALETQGLEDLPPIYAHEKDIEQMFFALAQNAIQAADGATSRWFRVVGACREGGLDLQFADNCGGIAPENLDRLFEPFFTTKPLGEGTGLGLCIVQRIVAQAGGTLRVDSRWGEGTTFFVTLPVAYQ